MLGQTDNSKTTCCTFIFFTTVSMNSTWKNLCPYRNLLSEKRTASTRTGSASHLLRKRTFFLLFFLTSHREICQQLDPVAGCQWDEYSFRGHFAGLTTVCFCTLTCSSVPDALQAELKLRLPTYCKQHMGCHVHLCSLFLVSREYIRKCFPVCFLIPVDWGHQSNWETESDSD